MNTDNYTMSEQEERLFLKRFKEDETFRNMFIAFNSLSTADKLKAIEKIKQIINK